MAQIKKRVSEDYSLRERVSHAQLDQLEKEQEIIDIKLKRENMELELVQIKLQRENEALAREREAIKRDREEGLERKRLLSLQIQLAEKQLGGTQ